MHSGLEPVPYGILNAPGSAYHNDLQGFHEPLDRLDATVAVARVLAFEPSPSLINSSTRNQSCLGEMFLYKDERKGGKTHIRRLTGESAERVL